MAGGRNNDFGLFDATGGGGGGGGSSAAIILGTGTCSSYRCGVGNISSIDYSASLGGNSNITDSCYGTIAGGFINCIYTSGCFSNISGGKCNYTDSCTSFTGSGYKNRAAGICPSAISTNNMFIGNGCQNTATSNYSSILNGYFNCSQGVNSFIGNGNSNITSANCGVVLNGYANSVYNNISFIGAGVGNTIYNEYSFVSGNNNIAVSNYSFIGNGFCNFLANKTGQSNFNFIGSGKSNGIGVDISSDTCNVNYSSTLGGSYNNILSCYSFIGGGCYNCIGYLGCFANSDYSVVLGGFCNYNIGDNSAIGGGANNTVCICGSTIIGGCGNTADKLYTTIGAGMGNEAYCGISTIIGGCLNCTLGYLGTIGGGEKNIILDGVASAIGGGCSNVIDINSNHSVIGGGLGNVLNTGSCSFIGGGCTNISCNDLNVIVGGICNCNSGCCFGVIGGGEGNKINFDANYGGLINRFSFIGGGSFNCSTNSSYSVIGGGCCNVICCVNVSNVILGGYKNFIECTLISVIVGGCENYNSQSCSFIGGGAYNCLCFDGCNGSLGVIGGGSGNEIKPSEASSIGGGVNNIIDNKWAIIGGGSCNIASNVSVVVGGSCNQSGIPNLIGSGFPSAIVGGFCNKSGYYGFIGGGCCNLQAISPNGFRNDSQFSTILGGGDNCIVVLCSGCPNHSTIGGGQYNTISSYSNPRSSSCSFIAGGCCNNTNCYNDVFILGSNLTATQSCTTFVNCLSVLDLTLGCGVCVGDCRSLCNYSSGSGYYGIIYDMNGTCNSVRCNAGNNASASNSYQTIFGLYNNSCSNKSTISGGANNLICCDLASTISGGYQNFIIASNHSTISGGYGNNIFSDGIGDSQNNTISGGYKNSISATCSGYSCKATSSVIGGGISNVIQNQDSVVFSGSSNQIPDINYDGSTSNSFIGGGADNFICGTTSFIGGGGSNLAYGNYSFIGGGCFNVTNSAYGVYVGGQSVVGGGSFNCAGDGDIIMAGSCNFSYSSGSFIGSGYLNVNVATFGPVYYNVILAGNQNTNSNYYSTISGGYKNINSGYASVIGNGCCNTNSSYYSVILGGQNNTNSANYGLNSILGGRNNCINGESAANTILGSEITVCDVGLAFDIRGGVTWMNNLLIKDLPTNPSGLPYGAVWVDRTFDPKRLKIIL